MQLVRKLLSLPRSHAGRNQKIRGLSTAELVGIIVIIGILGALGGTYIGSLITTAKANTLNQNAQSLNTLCASMLASGVPIKDAAGKITSINGVAMATDAAIVTALNAGIPDPVTPAMVFKLSPQIATAASYTETCTDDGSGNVVTVSWSGTAGATP